MQTNKKQLVAVVPHECTGVDVSDTTAGQGDVRTGKYFYSALGNRVEGQVADYSGATSVTPTEQAQTVGTAGKYVGSDITVAAIPSEYKDTTGTDATAGDILAGKKAVTSAGLITGNYTPPVAPTLVTKSITANGTYSAASDNADGFSEVTVNVPATPATPIAENDVTFYDYDGTVVASYTAAEFANLTAMPTNPSHTGLVAEGWNWTLADAKAYVASYGILNIGQMYHTESGLFEVDIEIGEGESLTYGYGAYMKTKDWGDGTSSTQEKHTYPAPGKYTIKCNAVGSFGNDYTTRAIRCSNVNARVSFNNLKRLKYVTLSQNTTVNGAKSCGLEHITLPIGVTEIGSSFFSYSPFKTISLPSSMQSLSNYAFSYTYALKRVIIPNGITEIKESLFRNSTMLQKAVIPQSVTKISQQAFFNAESISTITIPSGVTTINAYAFGFSAISGNDTMMLKIITILATTPPTLANTNAFPSTVTTIYIPNGTLSAYQTATNWSSFSEKFVELPA